MRELPISLWPFFLQYGYLVLFLGIAYVLVKSQRRHRYGSASSFSAGREGTPS